MSAADKADMVIRLDGGATPDKSLIGGKAWSLAQMSAMNLKVPPAFVITTKACLAYLEQGDFPDGLMDQVEQQLAWLEQQTGRQLGGAEQPLLLSVRSGAAISMPGMMDTVLNLGINAPAQEALARETGLPAFAKDTHRRFLELYSAIVLKNTVELAPDSDPEAWRSQIAASGADVPTTVRACLEGAIRAVFESWNTRRAKRYREHNGIAHDLGTAVTIQAMVFGNLDENSGTGVLFSRNPLTGERLPYGEYLPRAQGEDVVSGKFTPLRLDAMQDLQPAAHAALLAASEQLERQHGDMQDIEFTVQSGELYLLQARSAKRAAEAAVRCAVEMVDEGLIDVDTALSRVSGDQVKALLLPRLAEGAVDAAKIIATGEKACPGVSIGLVVTDSDEAERRSAAGEDLILLRSTTSPDDVHGMIAARAIITESGGSTSHAAVVSRALGRPSVVGIGADHGIKSGDLVTVDGANGLIYSGALDVCRPDEKADALLSKLIEWARARSPIKVISPDEATDQADILDVDPLLAAAEADVESLNGFLAGVITAKGQAFSDPAAAKIAVQQGVKTIITDPILPALLAVRGLAA